MSALDKMLETVIITVLKNMNVDVDDLKREVTTRIVAFETNLKTLNKTLIAHHQSLERIEDALTRIENKFDTVPTRQLIATLEGHPHE